VKDKKCRFCGKVLKKGEVHEFDGSVMCKACFDTMTSICEHCEERIWNDENNGSHDFILCQRCYDNHYTTCERCGQIIHYDSAMYFDDEDNPYCGNCFDILSKNNVIHDYGYKPEPIFYGKDDMYMGVELEIDKGGEFVENAEKLLYIANFPKEHLYIKHDGSIEEGFELVTHPMTLEYHEKEMPWEKVFEKALSMGYRSHQTQTCGLHIHINRSAFGKTYEQQEEVVSRIVYFVENHWNELLKFSRRTEENMSRWASRYGIMTTAKATYKNAKDRQMGRYVAVNLENYNTIEFRIFRGTLNYKTFIATLQLIDEICFHALHLSDKEMEGMSWSYFVSMILPKKAELIQYLKAKRLYVNEPTEDVEVM